MQRNIPAKRRKRRLRKPVKRFIAALVALGLLVLFFFIMRGIFDSPDVFTSGNSRISYFKDINPVHLRFARIHGISPIKSGTALQSQVEGLVKRDKLVRIDDTEYYVIDRLTHSHPYLVPEAADLLEMIGKRFQKKLKEQHKEEYLFRVTSLLRTQESQKKLRHSNQNATGISAHLYGTTFDITYRSLVKKSFFGREKVVRDGPAISLLSETIGELRNERRLLVVTERKEACFHITMRN